MLVRHHGERATSDELRTTFFMADPLSVNSGGFDFMFPDLVEDPNNLLPEGEKTVEALRALGVAMGADPSSADGEIPAMFTYFGQFIDHDITKTELSNALVDDGGRDIIEAPNFKPLSPQMVRANLFNGKTPQLDLDSVYGGLAATDATNPDGTMALSDVSPAPFGTIPSEDKAHDLPRREMIVNPTNNDELKKDREALIGDPRNDENLLVAQMHTAFLRSHNALMKERGMDPEAAKTALRRRYQWAVLHDFLKRISTKGVFDRLINEGPKFFKPDNGSVFMPLEFSGAAYRFGHSMVRAGYNHNQTFTREPFFRFFTFTALSGDLSPSPGASFGFEKLPDNWIIDWNRFFTAQSPNSQNPSRRIDTAITPELNRLPNFQGVPITTLMGKLASRNLLRGYLFGLPTGQAIASKIGAQKLSENELISQLPSSARTMFEEAGFGSKTPLWFYVLAEASVVENGLRLGEVGSTIVGETLWSLVAKSEDSVIGSPPTDEELASGEFSLEGIINIGRDKVVGSVAPSSFV